MTLFSAAVAIALSLIYCSVVHPIEEHVLDTNAGKRLS
jgi:hypothetical protein